MANRGIAPLTLLTVAALLTCQQSAQAQWWKNVLQNQGGSGYQQPYGQPGYGQYQQPYGGQYGQYNQYNQQQYGQNGTNPNLSNVADSMKNVERSADQIIKQGMYAPQANNPALMLTLNTLKDGARQARRAADSNDTNSLMMKLSQLQTIAGNALAVAQRGGTNSYTIAQLQNMQSNIQQSMVFANTMPSMPSPYPYNPYTPVNPYNGFNPGGILQVSSSGRGQFSLMGQVLMGIKQASISCMDGRRATMTISQGGVAINLTGTVMSQTPNSATISVSGSDRGAATGIVNSVIGGNGRLMSANGNGTLNGQPFVLSFNGN
jgi:hypothetical protein